MCTTDSYVANLTPSLCTPTFPSPPLSVQYDGKRVVSGAYDYLVKVWDPLEGVCLHTLQGHTNRVYSLQVSSTASGQM